MKCNICEKDFPDSCFYILKDGRIDPVCKECRCAKCSDDKPWTFFTIMMYYDIPYIEEEWLALMKHQIKKTISDKTPYTTIFGKYLSKMKLCSFKNAGFYDSAKLNYNFQKNWYDRNLFLDDNVASYLKILTKERDFNE